MRRIALSVLMTVFAATWSLAQNSAQASGSASQSGTVSVDQLGAQANSSASASASEKASAGNAAAANSQVQAGSIIYADLDKSVDAKKAKVGDPVVAKVQQAVLSKGKIVAPKGAKILGHVTQVQVRSKEQGQSQLGIMFDHIVLKDGSQIPVSLTIQAIGNTRTAAALAQDSAPSMDGPMSSAGVPGRPSGPSILGGSAGTLSDVSRTAGAATDGLSSAATTSTQVDATTHVGASSHGLVGIPDVTMASEVRGSTQATLLTSDKKNVKLEGGSELVLRAQ